MKITVYKGFDVSFLSKLSGKPLVDNEIADKLNILNYTEKTRKQLGMALFSLKDDDSVWAVYEEYTLVKNIIDDAINEDGLELLIYINNLYPEYYPLPFKLSDELVIEIEKILNSDSLSKGSKLCQSYLNIYNTLDSVDGVFYGSFYNFEYDRENITSIPYYPENVTIEEGQTAPEYDLFINGDVNTYLCDLARIKKFRPSVIGLKMTDSLVSERILSSLKAYCIANHIRIVKYHEQLVEDSELEQEIIDIAKNDIHIDNFRGFREIKFYKSPDIDKETVEISQSKLIEEIIHQAERSYDDSAERAFRDIFITASTGAGKSVMFQIPAIYLAKHYHKLTIIIEPVKSLMQDQKEKLIKKGFTRVEAFNSDLISQIEKEEALKRIKGGEVDLLYLSPETLLSYSVESIVGDREIGLLIVDEAHIVTTWGMGFRPDYWYLGGYINRLRNRIQTTAGRGRKVYKFPVCAFTATAINGGVDDSVSDTIISLYMENPVKYLGYARRDDISFDIKICESGKLPRKKYEEKKTAVMTKRIDHWLEENEKTIVYFPYAKHVSEASKGIGGFAGIKTDKRIGVYTGKNVDKLGPEAFNEKKRETFDKFRSGEQLVVYATKAFGMGVDIDDVRNVYHYAVSGNLSDYVQEVGRAARKPGTEGVAITDFFYNDMFYMNELFGMSQIRQYQVKKVLEGIYDTYKSKKRARSFLISPQSFTYIFNGKSNQNEDSCISKLKTCLLMLEKDFYDKYNFKVIVSRPQSVFTKAFVVIIREDEDKVLSSEYGRCFKFLAAGRYRERQPNGSLLSDVGDIYELDLKRVWEEFYPNISFPQFKYWYFNNSSDAKDKIEIMPSVRDSFAPRQKINIESRGDLHLNEIRGKILSDIEYIGNTLHQSFGNKYFTTDQFTKSISEKYGKTQARVIANSLFDLVDPNNTCVKRRIDESSGKNTYVIPFGTFKEYMKKPVLKSYIVKMISEIDGTSYSGYINITNGDLSNVALKLLSIFGYITYEILGGEEPEIFIRLNDPQKVENIVMGNLYYSNDYVSKAKKKHERDVNILLRFFKDLRTDQERWDYIEDYFLGKDILCLSDSKSINTVSMAKCVDNDRSQSTRQYRIWSDLSKFFDDNDLVVVDKIAALGVQIPEYLETVLKKNNLGENIIMSWPSKNTLICRHDTADNVIADFKSKGWSAFRIHEVVYDELKDRIK